MPLNPLRLTVMLPLRMVPAVTNSEEPLPPLPTRPDTRRTLTESGVASTAPRSDTESLALRPMRLTLMVAAPLRTTVPELVPLASALPVRVAGELPPPAPMAATHGVAPEVTGEPPLLESRVLAPTEVEWMMDPLRLTPTWVTNLTPTLTPMPATEASPTRRVAMVTPLRAAPVTDHGLMPPPEAPLTTGLDRELPRVPRATATALPTRSPTATAG